MQSFLVSALLVGVPFVVGAPASPRADSHLDVFARASLEERGTCNADNLLRLLRTPTNLPEALPFCSSYLHYPASTSVVSTVTPIVLSTTTATVSLTDILTSTITSIDTALSTETAAAAATVTITQQAAIPEKRTTPKKPLSESVLCSYDPARISSACACLTISGAVSLTTATAPTQTQISSATVTAETTTTAIETTLTTTTLGTTVTTSTTSTATVAPPPVPTNFRLTGIDPTGAQVYFKQTRYGGLYDVLVPTANAAESETFHLDASNRLYFTSVQFSASVFAFYSAPFAAQNQSPSTSVSSAMFAFQTSQWLAQSSSPVYQGFTWSIDPYTLALTQTSFPGVSFLLQSCPQSIGGKVQNLVQIGQIVRGNCAVLLSHFFVESV